MQLISISGIDGSGKSTQLKKLIEYLDQNQKKYYYFHGIDFSLANKILKFFSAFKKNPSEKRAVIKSGKKSILLRKIFLIIDIFRFKRVIQNLKKQKYEYVLADRYFYDQIINILFLEKREMPLRSPFWLKKSEKIMPIPTASFYIKVSPLEALSRERNIEQGFDYLKKKAALYEKAVFRWKLTQIFGEQSPEKVFEKIISNIKEK